jgi:hypothetical protein
MIIALKGNQSPTITTKGGFIMANCSEMKQGDFYYCSTCDLELAVKKACTCGSGSENACSVPLMCCGKEMIKKSN